MRLRATTYALTLLLVLSPEGGLAQFGLKGRKPGKPGGTPGILGGKSKEAESLDSKDLGAYERLKVYSAEKYETDPDFKRNTDRAYRELTLAQFTLVSRRESETPEVVNFQSNSTGEDAVYGNALIQQVINAAGQQLSAGESERRYSFQVLLNPLPETKALSTGSIYVSTGLLSFVENSSQLMYVLAHEIGHVALGHWKERVAISEAIGGYTADQARKVERIAALSSLAGGAGIGLGARSALSGASSSIDPELLRILEFPVHREVPSRDTHQSPPLPAMNWDREEEDAADTYAMKLTAQLHLGLAEVLDFYTKLQAAVNRDPRVGLGEFGDPQRLKERVALLTASNTASQAEPKADTAWTGQTGISFAELRRDNGILAFRAQMNDLARSNLTHAGVALDSDAIVHYYLGRALEAGASTPQETSTALGEFRKAIALDSGGEIYDAYREIAVILAASNPADLSPIREALNSYVQQYAARQRKSGRSDILPPDIDWVSRYMSNRGTLTWVLPQ